MRWFCRRSLPLSDNVFDVRGPRVWFSIGLGTRGWRLLKIHWLQVVDAPIGKGGPGEYRFEPELLKILKQSVGPLVRTCRSLECSWVVSQQSHSVQLSDSTRQVASKPSLKLQWASCQDLRLGASKERCWRSSQPRHQTAQKSAARVAKPSQ